jgi:hypothetical protein
MLLLGAGNVNRAPSTPTPSPRRPGPPVANPSQEVRLNAAALLAIQASAVASSERSP